MRLNGGQRVAVGGAVLAALLTGAVYGARGLVGKVVASGEASAAQAAMIEAVRQEAREAKQWAAAAHRVGEENARALAGVLARLDGILDEQRELRERVGKRP